MPLIKSSVDLYVTNLLKVFPVILKNLSTSVVISLKKLLSTCIEADLCHNTPVTFFLSSRK